MTTDEYLDSRFIKREPYKGKQYWMLQEYDNSGADYGLILMKLSDDVYRLDQYSDSGYTGPYTISELGASSILRLAEAMRPTNPACQY